MVSCHTCVESCFSARTSDKLTVNCFLCDKKFNAKCFDLSSQPTVKILSSTNNVSFMCYRCIDRVTKMKQGIRRSTESSTAVKSTNEMYMNNHGDNMLLSNVMALLNQMNDNLTKIKHSKWFVNYSKTGFSTRKHWPSSTSRKNVFNWKQCKKYHCIRFIQKSEQWHWLCWPTELVVFV